MKYIERIAKTDQLERKQTIIDILNEIGAKFEIQNARVGEYGVENIVISCNPSNTRLVIGAHYDSIENSTGANDNASGCSVLLHLIELLKNTKRSIDFVFFDREEYADQGSEGYIDAIGKENISAMINLDVCGHGETITVSDKGNINNSAFYNVLDKKMIDKHKVAIVGMLPNGDDRRFDERGIPNISVCTLIHNDIDFFRYLGNLKKDGKSLTEEEGKQLEEQLSSLDVISTMHLGANDNIFSCNQLCIDKVTKWLLEGLSN